MGGLANRIFLVEDGVATGIFQLRVGLTLRFSVAIGVATNFFSVVGGLATRIFHLRMGL